MSCFCSVPEQVVRASRGFRKQANPLIIADRLDLPVCGFAHFPDRQRHALDPVVATGPTVHDGSLISLVGAYMRKTASFFARARREAASTLRDVLQPMSVQGERVEPQPGLFEQHGTTGYDRGKAAILRTQMPDRDALRGGEPGE